MKELAARLVTSPSWRGEFEIRAPVRGFRVRGNGPCAIAGPFYDHEEAPHPGPLPASGEAVRGNILAPLTGLGLGANNVQSSCVDLFRVSTSLFQPLQGVDGRHKATAVQFRFLPQL